MHLAVEELLLYTDEERGRWERWFRENGEEMLKVPILGDRENTIGTLILNIFGPELRFVQRIQGEIPADYRNRPHYQIDALFGFGIESRKELRKFIRNAQPEEWGRLLEIDLDGQKHRASVRKVVMHVLIHEIRHWAEISRLMRERGFYPPPHPDLLTSAALI